MQQKDYYQVLQVSPNAPLDQIRAAYKRLALRYHPDLSPHPRANQKMQLLNEAYSVLANPEKRQRYNQERLKQPSPVQGQQRVDTNRPARPSRAERDRKLITALRVRLKILAWLFFLAIGLFGTSLLTGKVNYLAVSLLVLAAVTVIISTVIKVRKLAV